LSFWKFTWILNLKLFTIGLNNSITTVGAVAIKSRLNSRSSRSLITSMCNIPKNPVLKPEPKAREVSGSNEIELSLSLSLLRASLSSSNLSFLSDRVQQIQRFSRRKPINSFKCRIFCIC